MHRNFLTISLALGACLSLLAPTHERPILTQKCSTGKLEVYYECTKDAPGATQLITFSKAEAYLLKKNFEHGPCLQNWTRNFSNHHDPIKKILAIFGKKDIQETTIQLAFPRPDRPIWLTFTAEFAPNSTQKKPLIHWKVYAQSTTAELPKAIENLLKSYFYNPEGFVLKWTKRITLLFGTIMLLHLIDVARYAIQHGCTSYGEAASKLIKEYMQANNRSAGKAPQGRRRPDPETSRRITPASKPQKQSLYSILGVEPTASYADITTAYKKLAMKWHPDKTLLLTEEDVRLLTAQHPGKTIPEAATEKFKSISTAFETLSDPNKRRKYDSVKDDVASDTTTRPYTRAPARKRC